MTANFSREQEAAIVAAVQQGKDDIMMWIANGSVPPTVTAFAQLHDHLDANTAGDLCKAGGQFANAFPQNDDAESELSVHAANRVQEALDNWLGSSTERIQWLVEETIDAALDAAVEKVQQILKVDAGDVAAVFFMGGQEEAVRDYFRRYVNGEISALLKDRAVAAPDN